MFSRNLTAPLTVWEVWWDYGKVMGGMTYDQWLATLWQSDGWPKLAKKVGTLVFKSLGQTTVNISKAASETNTEKLRGEKVEGISALHGELCITL